MNTHNEIHWTLPHIFGGGPEDCNIEEPRQVSHFELAAGEHRTAQDAAKVIPAMQQ